MAAMCGGVEPQQPPTRLSQPLRGELAEHGGHVGGRLVVAAEGIGQAGVRVTGDVALGDRGEFFDVGRIAGRRARS
jgi:hypothetical protein